MSENSTRKEKLLAPLAALIVGFVLYAVLAKAGLESPTLSIEEDEAE